MQEVKGAYCQSQKPHRLKGLRALGAKTAPFGNGLSFHIL